MSLEYHLTNNTLNQWQRNYTEQDHGYKWYKRYNDEGLEGLKDKPRSGKPSTVSKEVKDKIKQELSESNIGWDTKQVMDLIPERTGVKYHKVHIRRLLHKWGFSSKVPQKRFVRTASKKEKNSFKKRIQNVLITLKNDWNLLVQDESILIHDSILTRKRRRRWILKEKDLLLLLLDLIVKQLFMEYYP